MGDQRPKHARDRWLAYSNGGGPKSFAEWCDLRFDEFELRDRVWMVLDDPELLAAVLAAVEAMPR